MLIFIIRPGNDGEITNACLSEAIWATVEPADKLCDVLHGLIAPRQLLQEVSAVIGRIQLRHVASKYRTFVNGLRQSWGWFWYGRLSGGLRFRIASRNVCVMV